jgi:hypothetical protein
MSFKEMGRGAETLPFDWVRTTLDGLVHFLASDFADYFDYTVDEDISINVSKTTGSIKTEKRKSAPGEKCHD